MIDNRLPLSFRLASRSGFIGYPRVAMAQNMLCKTGRESGMGSTASFLMISTIRDGIVTASITSSGAALLVASHTTKCSP